MSLTWLRRRMWQPSPSRGQRRSRIARKYLPRLEPLEDRLLLSVYAVINTADSGEGSLRQAILDANAHTSEANTILFDIPGQGPQTIRPLSALPTITNPVTIDATSQPDYAGTPLIELDGSLAGSNANGLTISAGNSVVRGLDIDRFGGAGIGLQAKGGNLIESNFIGTDITGAIALGNGVGIQDDAGSNANTIGAIGAGNVISGNSGNGVYLNGSNNNLVQGNFVGTDASGTQALGNSAPGVFVFQGSNNTIGGTAPAAGNLVSANTYGIYLLASNNNIVQGNMVGTDVTGESNLGNTLQGVEAFGTGNLIGGTASGAGNLISANGGSGVFLYGSNTQNNTVQGNTIGTDLSGTQALGNREGVDIDNGAFNNLIGGPASGAGNLISGNQTGVFLFSGNNTLQGNRIGTDINGAAAVANSVGVSITASASGNTIGGTSVGAGNLISGNGNDGIDIASINNLIQGNLIGTDITGTQALGNGGNGLYVTGANNTIGGTAAGAGNTIAFNGNDGVLVDTGTGDAILSDLIFASANLGIEPIDNGNHNQAAPVLASAVENGVTTVIQGNLQSTPNTTFTVQLFADPSADSSGSAEGQQLLGAVTVTTDASGFTAFTATIAQAVPAGQVVTATATDAGHNTSAFAAPVEVRFMSVNFVSLHSFTSNDNRSSVQAGVAVDSSGNLYGVTKFGGPYDGGIVYKLSPDGTFTILYNLSGGSTGTPLLDSSGDIFDTTEGGGPDNQGTVFELSPNESSGYDYTTLHNFTGSDGSLPEASLIADGNGDLFGTTFGGGPNNGSGTVFELSPNGSGGYNFTTLHSFIAHSGDGFNIISGLVMDSAGNLYGTTDQGGHTDYNGWGVVYKLSPNGSGGYNYSVLHEFTGGSDGGIPVGGLILDGNGNLLGTTFYGGNVFKLRTDGSSFSNIFNLGFGAQPEGALLMDSFGNLFGTTSQGNGTVFELSPNGSGGYISTTVHTFNGNDGASPFAGLTEDSNGNFYGTTLHGGTDGLGTVFEITGAETGSPVVTG